ncbi:GAF and ANTAR domain-containing protein [Nonomuraea sp. LPB2021202275-12-8]|uniref:GAF and ANTAR domain-containing protein n=1 Tax=Nonomuraea sp. LPB2021202275-12-8 TaxID=3120159 RepID=UPI00300CAFBD
MAREQLLARVFVELADTLVADFDVIEFLHLLTERCVQVLGVDAAGLLLTDQADHLQLVAASSEQSRILELFQLQADQGPCLDCYATGTQVAVADLAAEAARWPEFAAAAHERGFAAVHAMPMRLREQVIGALNLFSATPGGLDADSAALGQAFADVATIGLLGERAAREQTLLSQQLQIALNTRVLIEQAKGMLAERSGDSVDEAFTTMRAYARANNRKLTDVAHGVINGDILLPELANTRKVARRPPA